MRRLASTTFRINLGDTSFVALETEDEVGAARFGVLAAVGANIADVYGEPVEDAVEASPVDFVVRDLLTDEVRPEGVADGPKFVV